MTPIPAISGLDDASQARVVLYTGGGLVHVPASSLGGGGNFVATRTDLKALDTTITTDAYLTEEGREGLFLWQTGNFSTQVTDDTTEEVYIKADAIATTAGAWVRVGASLTGSFWAGDTPHGRIHRFADRVFVGDAVEIQGVQSPGTSGAKTWVGNSNNGFMTYFETRSQQAVFSTIGAVAGAFATQSSDNTRTGELAGLAVAGYALNNNTNAADKKSCWALYGHAAQTQANKFTTSLELDTCSTQTLVDVTPYSTGVTGTTAVAWLGVGGETAQGLVDAGAGASLTNVSVGLAFVNTANTATGNRLAVGLVFGANALAGTDGDGTGAASAIQMARRHKHVWKKQDGNDGFYIFGDLTNAGAATSLRASDTGIEFILNSGPSLLRVTSDSTKVNGLTVTPGATGVEVGLTAHGTDTNVGLAIRGKGTEGVKLQNSSGTTRFEVNSTGIGFFNTTPIAKPTITGSRAGNAALTSLLTQLTNLGLITNGTSA